MIVAYFSEINIIILIERTRWYAYFVEIIFLYIVFDMSNMFASFDDASIFRHMLHDANFPFARQIYLPSNL